MALRKRKCYDWEKEEVDEKGDNSFPGNIKEISHELSRDVKLISCCSNSKLAHLKKLQMEK